MYPYSMHVGKFSRRHPAITQQQKISPWNELFAASKILYLVLASTARFWYIGGNIPWQWNHFCTTEPLWGESTGYLWFVSQKPSNVELWCFFDISLNKLQVIWEPDILRIGFGLVTYGYIRKFVSSLVQVMACLLGNKPLDQQLDPIE